MWKIGSVLCLWSVLQLTAKASLNPTKPLSVKELPLLDISVGFKSRRKELDCEGRVAYAPMEKQFEIRVLLAAKKGCSVLGGTINSDPYTKGRNADYGIVVVESDGPRMFVSRNRLYSEGLKNYLELSVVQVKRHPQIDYKRQIAGFYYFSLKTTADEDRAVVFRGDKFVCYLDAHVPLLGHVTLIIEGQVCRADTSMTRNDDGLLWVKFSQKVEAGEYHISYSSRARGYRFKQWEQTKAYFAPASSDIYLDRVQLKIVSNN